MKTMLTLSVAVAMIAGTAQAATLANILGKDGSIIGSVELHGTSNTVVMRVDIGAGSLTPGWHGIHLHSVGDCSDIGVYKHSKGHVGKVKDGHGLLNPEGPEPGDLTNLWVGADGSAKGEFSSTTVGLDALKAGDGSALVIHANPDDHITQPIGGAGPRVACAEIR